MLTKCALLLVPYHAYTMIGKTEMKEFNFILTKKIQINSCTYGLDLSETCDNYMSQKPVVKNVCNNHTPKLIVACVGTCVCNCT